jgi:hypothetical protein
LCSAKLEPRPISEQFTASEQGKKSWNYEEFKGNMHAEGMRIAAGHPEVTE